MKVVNKPIEVICKTNFEGIVTPVKFRMMNDDEAWCEIKVDHIVTREFEKLAGNKMLIFNCQSNINNILKPYQLKMEIDSCKWILFKI